MHEQRDAREQRLAYEKLLYRYSTALEYSDFDTIISVLHLAESDSYLEQLIIAIHEEGYQQEEAMLKQDHTNHQSTPSQSHSVVPDQPPVNSTHVNKPNKPRKRWLKSIESAVAVLAVAALIMGTLFLFASHNKTGATSIGNGGVRQQPGSKSTAQQSENDIVVTVSVATGEGTIAARNVHTNASLWSYVFEQSVDINAPVGLVVQGSTVYVASNKQVQALQLKDGKLLWKTILGTADSGVVIGDNPPSLAVDHGLVYASGYVGGNLYTLNAKTGKIIWGYNAPIPALLVVSNGIAYVLANDNNDQNAVKALNGTDGRELWHYDTPMPLNATVANNVLFVQAAHSLKNDFTGFHKEQKPLFALNATDGKQLWSVIAPANAPSPLLVAQNALILFNGNHFCGYDVKDGKQLWCADGPGTNVSGAGLTSIYGIVYGTYETSSMSTFLEAIDPQTGKVNWSNEISKFISLSPNPQIIPLGNDFILLDNQLILQRTDGKVIGPLPGDFIIAAASN